MSDKSIRNGIGHLFVLGAFLGCAQLQAEAVPAFPTANPDDQIRFFWQMHSSMYPELRDAGFNNIIQPLDGSRYHYDFEKAAGYEGPLDELVRMSEEWKRDGIDWTLQILPARDKTLQRKYARLNRDGSVYTKPVMDMTTPGCLDEIAKMADYYARRAKEFKCGIGIQPATEERMHTKPNFAPHAVAAFKAATGLDMPPEAGDRAAPHWSKLKDFPADRIVDRNHPVLAYYRWFWQEGDGFEKGNDVMVEAFRRNLGYEPFSIYDPSVRVPPLWGSGGKVSHIEQWKVADPYPYQTAYLISEQKTMAAGCPGQGVLMLVQGISSAHHLAPTNDLPAVVPEWRRRYPTAMYVTPAPDLVLEQLWSAFSRQTDGVGTHGWDSIWMNAADIGRWRYYYVHANPETKKVFHRVFNEIGIPLGPLFRNCPEPEPEVAVLESYSAAILSGHAWWDWMTPFRICGFLAEGANLQPAALYEEQIARDGIPASVKVILASEVDVVTKETAEALRAFQARGGRIIADKLFVPGLTADARLPTDWGYGLAMAEERDAKWGAAAAALAKTVRAIVPARIRSSSPDILLRARRYGTADYVFAINDRRDFGDYIGPWKRMREKGAPNEGYVYVKREAGAVYDLVRHQAVPFQAKKGWTRVPVSYTTCDGRLLLLTEKPLGDLAVTSETTADGLKVTVTSPDRDVMLPIGVTVGTAKPYYGVTRDGAWSHVFRGVSEASVKVLDLADGRTFGK